VPDAVREFGEFGDRLDGAGLVVGVHDRDQYGPVGQGRGEVARRQPAGPVHGQHGDLDVVPVAQVSAGVKDGGVLRGLGDDLGAADGPAGRVAGQGGQHTAADGQGVGLGAAAGEHDLVRPVRVGTDQGCHLGASGLQAGAGGWAVVMAAGGVAEPLAQIGLHGIGDPGVDRGSGVVIEVDHHVTSPVDVVRGRSARVHSSTPSARRRAARPWLVNSRTAS
jgi:hypothetical protein